MAHNRNQNISVGNVLVSICVDRLDVHLAAFAKAKLYVGEFLYDAPVSNRCLWDLCYVAVHAQMCPVCF